MSRGFFGRKFFSTPAWKNKCFFPQWKKTLIFWEGFFCRNFFLTPVRKISVFFHSGKKQWFFWRSFQQQTIRHEQYDMVNEYQHRIRTSKQRRMLMNKNKAGSILNKINNLPQLRRECRNESTQRSIQCEDTMIKRMRRCEIKYDRCRTKMKFSVKNTIEWSNTVKDVIRGVRSSGWCYLLGLESLQSGLVSLLLLLDGLLNWFEFCWFWWIRA